MYVGLHVKCLLCLSDFNQALKGQQIGVKILVEVRPFGAELFHVGMQMDKHDKANSCSSHSFYVHAWECYNTWHFEDVLPEFGYGPVNTFLTEPLYNTFFFLYVNSQHQAWAFSLLRLLDYTQTHTPGRTPLNRWSVCRRSQYLHSTQHTWEINIHVLSRIQAHDPSNHAALDIHLRLRGHWD